MAFSRTRLGLLSLLGLCLSSAVCAQATQNFAATISYAGITENRRADTLCVAIEAGSILTFESVNVTDSDIVDGIAHARVELNPSVPATPGSASPGWRNYPASQSFASDPIRFASMRRWPLSMLRLPR